MHLPTPRPAPPARPRWSRFAVGVIAACGLVAALSARAYVGAQQPQATAALACPPSDLVYVLEPGLYATYAGSGGYGLESRSAIEAIRQLLAQDHPYLAGLEFRVAAESVDAIQLVHDSGSGRVVSALVEREGVSWQVTSFAACNSFLLATKEAAGA